VSLYRLAADVDVCAEQSVPMIDIPRRVLDPVERVSEVLFGLIMVLTFTGSVNVADAGRAEVHQMLVGALGCNLAWGIVDAVMYVISSVLTRSRGLAVLRTVRDADPERARTAIAVATAASMPVALSAATLEVVRQEMVAGSAAAGHVRLTAADATGAVSVFLLVFLSTFPVVIPFLVFGDIGRAMRVSNAIAVALLCGGGYSLGRYGGLSPWWTAGALAALGITLVSITMALGG